MTPAPKTVAHDDTVEQASEYMRKLHIRHLPVTKEGHLIGIISSRDISLVLNFRPQSAATDKVESALTPDPYIVGPDAPFSEVAGAMASEKFGCVLVMENGKLAGIFTTVDALRLLSDIFKDEIEAQP